MGPQVKLNKFSGVGRICDFYLKKKKVEIRPILAVGEFVNMGGGLGDHDM